MKRLFKLVVVALVLSGWPLALSAIHVVRTPGQVPGVGSMLPADWGTLHVFTKEQLGFKQTFADTRKWDLENVAMHHTLVTRMQDLKLDDAIPLNGSPADVAAALAGDYKAPPAPATPVVAPQHPVELVPQPQAPPTDPWKTVVKPVDLHKPAPATQPADHKPTSIFDF